MHSNENGPGSLFFMEIPLVSVARRSNDLTQFPRPPSQTFAIVADTKSACVNPSGELPSTKVIDISTNFEEFHAKQHTRDSTYELSDLKTNIMPHNRRRDCLVEDSFLSPIPSQSEVLSNVIDEKIDISEGAKT